MDDFINSVGKTIIYLTCGTSIMVLFFLIVWLFAIWYDRALRPYVKNPSMFQQVIKWRDFYFKHHPKEKMPQMKKDKK